MQTKQTEETWNGEYLERLWVPSAVGMGLLLGIFLPAMGDDTDPAPWGTVSRITGWTYFCAWSVSFYPQVFYNWRRKSVEGLSLEFQLLNLVGFICYSVYNCALFFSEEVRNQQTIACNCHSKVKDNDVFFALHATLLTSVTVFQFVIYPHGPKPSSAALKLRRIIFLALFVFSVFAVVLGSYVFTAGSTTGFFSMYSYIVLLSLAKVVITLIKYLPQVYLNYTRQSTVGWNINNVLLDFIGGGHSVAQLLVDCASTDDWDGLVGDPAKVALGNTSMVFDVIFMIQHYYLYNAQNIDSEGAQICPNTDCGGMSLSPDGKEPLLNTASSGPELVV